MGQNYKFDKFCGGLGDSKLSIVHFWKGCSDLGHCYFLKGLCAYKDAKEKNWSLAFKFNLTPVVLLRDN